MINLQPYSNPMYFVWLLVSLLPLMIGLYFGKRFVAYQTIISGIFLLLIFGGSKWQQGLALIGYIIFQFIVVGGYVRYKKRANQTWVFVVAVLLSILPLVIVKITPAVQVGRQSLVGFLGISYLTFKSVQMIMETRDGTIKKFDPIMFARFLLFFPTVSSGPIDRYRRFQHDYLKIPDRERYLEMLGKAVHYIFLGFLYKFILSYLFGTVMLPHIAHIAIMHRAAFFHTGISLALVGYMYTYSMYLFFDFAGYSLFAVAASYLMGIETPMNFNQPFKAHNIKDFWNRWHMTLSFWFRDFIFMRLTFFIVKHHLLKKRVRISQVTYLANFLIMGFWHGVTWYYIVYGLFHASAIITNDYWLAFKKKHRRLPHNRLTEGIAIFITFNVVCFSFLIFSGFLNTLWFQAH
ncbi:D-alanyl-lipoteichoic acid biosynthesis protein DltB [Loigolactobacillus coryniformis]|uniref:Teichoic acid D-alanyltransferase n=1 Tax=Loigolactobacillus coryniformis TaxID=1610 RepID=A0A5B8TH38_9LACO|nr:D-alanyl-lipoteichoic acid biosynthesis protein DltB [Loigolactobacillus coryniformis]QEA52476.1 D-alanyl-lipoteichoic acid biosynthesis protein DltB [Loigolactobacillus coryniformis]